MIGLQVLKLLIFLAYFTNPSQALEITMLLMIFSRLLSLLAPFFQKLIFVGLLAMFDKINHFLTVALVWSFKITKLVPLRSAEVMHGSLIGPVLVCLFINNLPAFFSFFHQLLSLCWRLGIWSSCYALIAVEGI